MYAVGIDVSIHHSTVAVLSFQTNIIIKLFDVPHTPDGIRRLAERLNTLDCEMRIVMEHTRGVLRIRGTEVRAEREFLEVA